MGLLKTREPSSPIEPADLPLWPSGIARFRDGILELTSGDGVRVPRRDIVFLDACPPKAGRSSLVRLVAAVGAVA